MADDRTFGQRVVWLRQWRGMEQKELARLAGMSASHLNRIERGVLTNPTPRTVRRLAYALDVTVDHLAGETGVRRRSPRR